MGLICGRGEQNLLVQRAKLLVECSVDGKKNCVLSETEVRPQAESPQTFSVCLHEVSP